MTSKIVIMKTLLVNTYEKLHFCRIDDQEGVRRMPLYNRLKEYRARIGANQSELGRMVGVSRQTISQIERGDYSPSVSLALRIAGVCDATVEDIFTYEEDHSDES